MKNRKYIVCRDNVFVGEVIRTGCVFQKDAIGISSEKTGMLGVGYWRSYRSILFTLNEANLADDLIYNSPNYPVLNISDNEKCMDFDGRITLINNACNLSELLRYFGYAEELTYDDMVKIRNTFFSAKFVYDNCELFGYKESNPENWTYYKNNVKITDPKEIKKCIRYYKQQQLFGYRSFSSVDEKVLSRGYFDVLEDRKDSTLIGFKSYNHKKLDAFAPHKHEGKIKKLSR